MLIIISLALNLYICTFPPFAACFIRAHALSETLITLEVPKIKERLSKMPINEEIEKLLNQIKEPTLESYVVIMGCVKVIFTNALQVTMYGKISFQEKHKSM